MANANKKTVNEELTVNANKEFKIPFPFLWLSIVIIMMYSISLNSGYTDLDDTIFINEYHDYNDNIANLAHSFHRGVFSDTGDTYYRPMLLNSFIINNQVAGSNMTQYHGFNILLHLIAVLLLFVLLQKLSVSRFNAFILTLLFAVHPALSQAVAWIPGRNDTLLAIFSFAFMICSLTFIEKSKWYFLLLQFIFLLGAFFTKETAVLLIPAFLILVYATQTKSWEIKQKVLLFSSWILSAIIWYTARSMASVKNPDHQQNLITGFFKRSPLAIQYLGKAILPFNLSVFPMMEQTTYLFGIVALILLGLGIYFSKERNNKIIIAGLTWFLLLLLPVFLLPANINDQDFEHRLYLPIVGLLLILPQTVLFKNITQGKLILVIACIIAVFAFLNYNQQAKFKDPQTFWKEAVSTTPKSSYAAMMLAARMDSTDIPKARAMMMHAYSLNPKEKYVNYYLGKQNLEAGNVDSAKKYLLAELENSAYYDTYFLLSRVEFLQKNTNESIRYMEKYLQKDPKNSQAINNYVLMLTETNQKEKALAFLNAKKAEGVFIRQELFDLTK